MNLMKASRIHQYGNTENFVYEDTARPIPVEGEVLIRVYASSVNRFDSAARAGYMAGYFKYEFPVTLGLDVSGTIEEVGSGVTDFKVGDEVIARLDPAKGGGYAEYVTVTIDHITAKPKSLSHVQAASVPHAAVTAWWAVIDSANISQGQTILIHGGAGGVGVFAIQLAKWRGAYVIATSSANNLDFLRELGADEVIDYPASKFEDHAHDVDVVFDTVGGDTLARSLAVLKPGGLLMSIVEPPNDELAKTKNIRTQFVMAGGPSGSRLTEIAALIDAGKIKPFVSTELGLHELQQAHDLIDTRHTRGKIVLKIID